MIYFMIWLIQDEGRKTAASTYLIDQSIQDFSKGGLEMQVHHQGTLGRRGNHVPNVMPMDSPPQRTTASGTLSGASATTATHPEALHRCKNLSSLSLLMFSHIKLLARLVDSRIRARYLVEYKLINKNQSLTNVAYNYCNIMTIIRY